MTMAVCPVAMVTVTANDDGCPPCVADCGGKLCYNNGYTDVSTCQCHCLRGWRGEFCEKSASSLIMITVMMITTMIIIIIIIITTTITIMMITVTMITTIMITVM